MKQFFFPPDFDIYMQVERKIPKIKLDTISSASARPTTYALRCQHDCNECQYDFYNLFLTKTFAQAQMHPSVAFSTVGSQPGCREIVLGVPPITAIH